VTLTHDDDLLSAWSQKCCGAKVVNRQWVATKNESRSPHPNAFPKHKNYFLYLNEWNVARLFMLEKVAKFLGQGPVLS